ncbi:peroxisomal sarcosine oxidase-like [Dysidea avara]|uniref:peroxisomal sarcosine oxidase-like n=1 Tax=Dysidea avara TaxID=196820 RepID=UPI00331DAEC5
MSDTHSRRVVYDVAVIGAGVIGSAAAYHIIKKGVKVVLIEQFDVGHTRGSSHGGSRITRHLYNTDYYTKMTIEAFPLWEQVEKESGITVYSKTGLGRCAPKHSETLSSIIASMHRCGLPISVLDSKQMKQRCPHLNLPDSFECVYEEDAGILAASKAVTALQNVFIKNGGKLLDCHPITEIVPGDVVVLKSSSKQDIRAKNIVVTVGPWAKKVLKPLGLDLPLRTVRKEHLYWKITPLPDNDGRGFEVVIFADDDVSEGCYITPEFEYPGLVKVNYNTDDGGIEVDPDARDADTTNQKGVEETKKFITQYLLGISTAPSIVEPCILTKTPDNDFIIDKHPKYSNIMIGVGFSGHGFKLAPVVGKILCEMTMNLPLSYDILPFAINRFKPSDYYTHQGHTI